MHLDVARRQRDRPSQGMQATPRAAELAAFVEWDVRNWSVALECWTKSSSQALGSSTALELGARHGGLSLWLALQGAQVVCSDVGGPSERAVQTHRAAGVAELVRYEAIDATDIPYTDRFDIVLFKSVLGAVGVRAGRSGQAKAIAEMHKALKPGGELFFAENLVASPLHRYLRKRFVKWGDRWRYVSIGEMLQFLAPFRQVSYQTVGVTGAFGRSPRQRNLLGAVDRVLLERLVPEQWRYIIVGVARK